MDENNNPKIAYQNLESKKYAFFEIKTQKENKTVYLYCSDVESCEYVNGIFDNMDHISISVIACNTEKVTNMACMFYECSSLTKLDLSKFNTDNVTKMHSMFSDCSSLTDLDIRNFNTTNVTNMNNMFYKCRNLKNLELGENFNIEHNPSVENMFDDCDNLPNEIRYGFLIKKKIISK